MKNYLLSRFKEPSTWRGIIMIATAYGMHISPDQAYAIASFGMAMAGGAGVVAPDSVRK